MKIIWGIVLCFKPTVLKNKTKQKQEGLEGGGERGAKGEGEGGGVR